MFDFNLKDDQNLFHSCETVRNQSPWMRPSWGGVGGFWHRASSPLHVHCAHFFEDTNLINSTLRLWISLLLWWSVTKWATWSRTFPHSAVCEEDGNPLFREGIVFSLLCSPLPAYLSCLYMWKTEQQTAALISFRPSAGLDFPPFPRQLWKIAHCSLKIRGGNLCSDFMSKHVRSQTSLPCMCFSPDNNYTHMQCVETPSPCTEKLCGPQCCVVWGLCVQ